MRAERTIEGVRDVTVIHPESGRLLEGQDIRMEKGRIASVEPAGKSRPAGMIDGSGLFAIPGLIDTHVHALGFYAEEVPGFRELGSVFRQQRKNLAAFLRSGVTTVRDMTSALNLIRRAARRAEAFEIPSPRILYAGPMFTVPGGYPYFVGPVPFLVDRIAGPIRIDLPVIGCERHVRSAVDRMARTGASCIKVGYQSARYDDAQTGIPLMPLGLLEVVVQQAHRRGLPVAVHHVFRRDLKRLLTADHIPFDSLEHLTIDETLNDDEVRLLAERGIPVSTTLMTYGIIDHLDRFEELLRKEPERFEPGPRIFLEEACRAMRSGGEVSRFIGRKCIDTGSDFMRKNLKRLREAGVKIVYGSDSGGAITPAGCPHWELTDMVRAGMSPTEALRSATSDAADAVGLPDRGRIEAGRAADLVLLGRNPMEDVEAVGEVAAVVREGRWVHGDRSLWTE